VSSKHDGVVILKRLAALQRQPRPLSRPPPTLRAAIPVPIVDSGAACGLGVGKCGTESWGANAPLCCSAYGYCGTGAHVWRWRPEMAGQVYHPSHSSFTSPMFPPPSLFPGSDYCGPGCKQLYSTGSCDCEHQPGVAAENKHQPGLGCHSPNPTLPAFPVRSARQHFGLWPKLRRPWLDGEVRQGPVLLGLGLLRQRN
jgi:hypothetical protein